MTASYGFTNCACPCIQQSLNDVHGRNTTALRRDKVGLVSFLLSPENTAGVEMIQVDSGKGKRKCVTLNWYQKMCESSINASCTDDCSTGDDDVPYCEDIEVDYCFEAAKNFDEDDMRRICAPLGERDQDWIASIMNGMFNAMNIYLDKQILALALANVGVFMDGSTIKAIQLFNTINSDAIGPRTRAIANIIDEFDQAALLGKPNIIGANEVAKWARMITYGTANAAGQDVGAMADEFNFFYDRFLEGVFGANEFLAIAPGVAHLLFWHKYVGDYQKANDVFEHSTITDPVTGITYDYKMHYNDCTDTYNMKLQLNYDFWVLPDEAADSCDDHYGVNGIFNYESCDDIEECEGASVS